MNTSKIKIKYWDFGMKLYNNPFLKKILKPIYRFLIFKKSNVKQNQILKEDGLRIINQFDKALSNNNISYYLMFGSMLGAVREKGFIKHDLDIDISININEDSTKIREILENAGFTIEKEITADNGTFAKEETYIKENVSIDVFYNYKYSEDMDYVCCFRNMPGSLNFEHSIKKFGGLYTVQYHYPKVKEIKRVKFEGKLMLPIPINADIILESIYGKDYMIPNPKYIPGSCKTNQKIYLNKIGIYTQY